jgi:hypothetical protein
MRRRLTLRLLASGLALALVASVAAPSFAQDADEDEAPRVQARYQHPRFLTFEASLGIAQTSADAIGGMQPVSGSDGVGIAPLSLSFGRFLDQRTAIMLRGAGTSYFYRNESNLEIASLSFYGVAVQRWVSDDAFVGAGAGFVLYGGSSTSGERQPPLLGGVGADLRAGYVFARVNRANFLLVVDLYPADVQSQGILGSALSLELQYL